MQNIIGMVLDVTARRAAEEALSSKARQQAAVAALGLQALVESRRSALFEQAVALVRQTLDVPYAAIFEVDETSDALRMSAQAGWPAAAASSTPSCRARGTPSRPLRRGKGKATSNSPSRSCW